MKKIDIISGIALLSGIALFSITASNFITLLLVPVTIFASYYTGRMSAKKEAWERFLVITREVIKKQFENIHMGKIKPEALLDELKSKEEFK